MFHKHNSGESKQLFAVCFRVGRFITEVYEVEAKWQSFKPISLKIVNYRWAIFSSELRIKNIYSNIQEDGTIDGIMFEFPQEKLGDKNWIKLKTSKPHEYGLQNPITFCRYQRFYAPESSQIIDYEDPNQNWACLILQA